MVSFANRARPKPSRKKEISHDAVYYHFRKWSRDGSLEKVWTNSILTVKATIDTSEINLDGSHAICKKGGEAVGYQRRKRAKTTNILPMTDATGLILASTELVAGHHHDAFELVVNLKSSFQSIKRLGVCIKGSYFNADSAFDTKDARKTCFNYGLIPNIALNRRNQKKVKRGRKRLFNAEIYKHRFVSERSFAWIDKFRALVMRYDRREAYFLAGHHIAYAMINLRHVIASQRKFQ